MAERPITLAYRLQAVGARLMLCLFGLLPLDAASALGGWLGRTIGPRLAMNRRARRNIARALPELSEGEIDGVIRGMWDNLGRVTAEYPHLHKFDCYGGPRVEVIGAEFVDELREDGRGGIFFSGHIANWEVCCMAATQRGVPVFQAYRAPNNPLIDPIIDRIRTRALGVRRYAKGASGARQLVKHLKAGDHLALLIDQKLNEGIPVPFFGRGRHDDARDGEFRTQIRRAGRARAGRAPRRCALSHRDRAAHGDRRDRRSRRRYRRYHGPGDGHTRRLGPRAPRAVVLGAPPLAD